MNLSEATYRQPTPQPPSNIRKTFLSGENTNLVLQSIIKKLNDQGIDVNIKDLNAKIPNFMNQIYQKYPASQLNQLNNFVIQTCVNKYSQQGNYTGGGNRRYNQTTAVNNQFERELIERGYQSPLANPPPNQPDFTQPTQNNSQQLSLSEVTGIEPPVLEDNQTAPTPVSAEPPPNQANNTNQIANNSQLPNNDDQSPPELGRTPRQPLTSSFPLAEEMLISLNKQDLLEIDQNRLVFSWKQIELPSSSNNYQISLKYVSIPKDFPYLMAKYSHQKKKSQDRVLTARGEYYSAKLIPTCHTNQEYTTYQALNATKTYPDKNQRVFTLELIPPFQQKSLNLSEIQVNHVKKTNERIFLSTKGNHHLSARDSISLEFLDSSIRTCYRITNLKIHSPSEISFDSPFVGYFSANFRLLRYNWDIDVTLSLTFTQT